MKAACGLEACLAWQVWGNGKRAALAAALDVTFSVLPLHKLFGDPEPRVVLAPSDFLKNISLDRRTLVKKNLSCRDPSYAE